MRDQEVVIGLKFIIVLEFRSCRVVAICDLKHFWVQVIPINTRFRYHSFIDFKGYRNFPSDIVPTTRLRIPGGFFAEVESRKSPLEGVIYHGPRKSQTVAAK